MENASRNVSPEPYTDYTIVQYGFSLQRSGVPTPGLIAGTPSDTKDHHPQE